MKINIQANSKASDQLIIIAKDKKPSKSFLKQNHIPDQFLKQSLKLGSTSFSNGNTAYHLLNVDLNAAFIVNKIAGWIQKHKSALGKELAVITSKEIDAHTTSVVLGILRGRYEIGLYKTGKKSETPFSLKSSKLTLIGNTAQKMALDMVNAPGNKLKPSDMAKTIKAAAKSGKYSVKVLSKKQTWLRMGPRFYHCRIQRKSKAWKKIA